MKGAINMRQLLEKLRRRRRARALYRIYVTDALYALCGFAGIELKGRYIDALKAADKADGMALSRARLDEMGIEVVS